MFGSVQALQEKPELERIFRGYFFRNVARSGRGDMTGQHPERDSREIDFDDPDEVRYWLKFLDTSRDELLAAVSAVGTSAQRVRDHLKAKGDGEPL
jgi:hypothetical protein